MKCLTVLFSNIQVKGDYSWMEVILEAKDAFDWVYRGEGAANLVLAYTGSSPSFVRSSFFLIFVFFLIFL